MVLYHQFVKISHYEGPYTFKHVDLEVNLYFLRSKTTKYVSDRMKLMIAFMTFNDF